MASLVDRVNKTLVRNANGQLVEQATPTSQLAGQAGLTAPPTTPAGVGALGGTAQQQAMAGSVAQKTSALRQSMDSVNTTGEAEADKRYRSSATADEQKKLDQQKRLGEVFGGTQQRVQDLIGAEINKQAAPVTPLSVAGALTVTDQSKQADVDATFDNVVKGVDTQANIVKLMALTGQTQDQIAAAAQDAVSKQVNSSTGQAAAGATADSSKVNVSALLPSIGTTREELASLLGLAPTAIDTMSIADLDAAVKATATQGGQSVAQVDQAAQNPLAGTAERAAAREQSREQSTTGQATSEAQLEDLGRSLENADTVQFGGKQYTVEQLLSDENISQLVSDYVTNPNSETSKQLAADPNSKGLLDFVNKYNGALTDAATKTTTALTKSEAIQDTNKELATVNKGLSIPDELMKGFYGDQWTEAQADKLPAKGFVKAVKSLTTQEQNDLKDVLPQLFTLALSDDILKQALYQTKDKETLLKLAVPNAHGVKPLDELKQNHDAERAAVDATKNQNVDQLLSLYFGQPMTQKKSGDEGANWGQVSEAQRKELGLDTPAVLKAAGITHGPPYAFQETMDNYAKGMSKLLSDKVLKSLRAADQLPEVAAGKTGLSKIAIK